ncbi:hypothetical protein [Pararobbsia silviterrae]|uniref:Uncharacterized protein n=1 Tax=Pararobbsia silviterrae TaxID=1792498 RepID=A0A494XMK4_9BURK|nr:hypothetical protein [Pararobbsia silviterrae]RKP51935.1 hypothetical protein D7S86_18525 [Pararobbsia silviterrae]
MKSLYVIGAVGAIAVAGLVSLAIAQTSDDAPASNIHGWHAPPDPDNPHHGWGAPRPGDPETGRMTEHGWVAPVNKDCSLNRVEIQGSAQVRCMK